MNKDFDFIIVGKGLAGITLAHHLVKLGKSVLLFDDKDGQSSSRVAAGLYNPVTGRKMVKTWKADQLFSYLESYYLEVQKLSEEEFFIPRAIYRPFLSTEEQNEWSARSADAAYEPYIKEIHFRSINDAVNNPFGGVELKHSGFLKVSTFLECATEQLLNEDGFNLIQEKFDEKLLKITETGTEYKGKSASKIIFCEGVQSNKSKFFDWLPFKPVKGDILTIEADIKTSLIINRGIFVIQIDKNRFKVGSTYNNYDLTIEPSQEGRATLEQKLKELISVNYKVVDHIAGIRPATKDRKPIIGMHPNYENVGIFNGLGTKGVSLAPYFANQFALHLVNQSALDKEVAIERYYALFNDDNN
ncbi:NAD(P)/FAD-dependent oxidoreductase [Fulvivirga lutea]|uniref:FAD-binding oxidoreductase n=1 Tax=Fulvivirga lutea TaxID=2810512 RepID=A0A974WH15_9BACT|nr:FAD-binding oxidoreductase [Fulvivirga lutea]QSE97935.1 FAD-binding oxidoreductase [Fulvivirga lutea]